MSPGFVPGNQVTLLRGGDAYFRAIEAAFERARHEIHLETYIYRDDATGQRIARALKRAASRGVEVRVVIDGFGSSKLPRSVLEDLRADGVQVAVFGPRISPWTFRRERLRRMHRKLVVVDRAIAFVGGINIVDDDEPCGDIGPRHDYAVVVQGPLVEVIHLAVARLWRFLAWRALRRGAIRRVVPPESAAVAGTTRAAFLVRDSLRHRRDIEHAYLRAIERAETEIVLAHAYFLPGGDFRHALVDAARRGVRVLLLLQGRVEYFLERHASRALYRELLDAGIEIHEYRRGYLHAKVAVIDGHWATVGSSNIDPFSLLLSREANVVVDDQIFCATLAKSIKEAVATDSRRISPDLWKRQPAALRLIRWLSYRLLRFAIGLSGHAVEYPRPHARQRGREAGSR